MTEIRRHLIGRLGMVVVLLPFLFSCGYQLVKDKGIFGGEISSLYLAVFKNVTYEPNLSQYVTDAFSKELLSTALFTVNRADSDGYLQGTVTEMRTIPSTLTDQGIANEKSVSITVDLALHRKNGGLIKRWGLTEAETYRVDNVDYEEYNKKDAIKRLSARMARRFSAYLLVDY